MSANKKHHQTDFVAKILQLQSQLGIPEDYASHHSLVLQQECIHPVSIGKDVFDREQAMAADAAGSWLDMQTAAATENIELQAVSAYRSVDYQAGIIRRKLNAGQCIEDILKMSAAPGYSEHHSGCALDITTPGFEPLEEEFENSHAFEWLCRSAISFGFSLSFPRNNPHRLAYEPWHWCWHTSEPDQAPGLAKR